MGFVGGVICVEGMGSLSSMICSGSLVADLVKCLVAAWLLAGANVTSEEEARQEEVQASQMPLQWL